MTDGGDLAVRARGIVKRFGNNTAVAGIDLDVPRGMIFAILGPDGAGKTTLLRMLATLLRPDGGEATLMGRDLRSDPDGVRGAISMTGQFASLDEDLTGRENLIMLSRLWGFRGAAARERAEALLTAFDLSEAGGKQVKSYSGRMRRRLDIAASLVVTPGVLFLDEPTTGLDPTARAGVWALIKGLAQSGVTILHHPAPRGGGPARRPHRGDRPRPQDRGRLEPGAQGADRLGRPPRLARSRRGPRPRGRGAGAGAGRACQRLGRRGDLCRCP